MTDRDITDDDLASFSPPHVPMERYRRTWPPIRVEVRKELLPFKSTNPETPGFVHWIFDDANGVLYCSESAFDTLSKLPDGDKDLMLFAMGASGLGK